MKFEFAQFLRGRMTADFMRRLRDANRSGDPADVQAVRGELGDSRTARRAESRVQAKLSRKVETMVARGVEPEKAVERAAHKASSRHYRKGHRDACTNLNDQGSNQQRLRMLKNMGVKVK